MKQLDNRSIETNGEIIKFDIAIRQIVEYKDFFEYFFALIGTAL